MGKAAFLHQGMESTGIQQIQEVSDTDLRPCSFILSVSHSAMFDSLQPHGLKPTRFLCPWDSPGKNTGVGRHFLLQGIFPTQGSDPRLLYYRQVFFFLLFETAGKPSFTLMSSN